MNTKDIEHNVQSVFEDFSKDEFIYDLLVAYGISKTSVTRLKKGDFNLSKIEGEVLYKKKIFFKVETVDQLLNTIDSISKEERILKHKPRFAIVTDYKELVAKDLKLGKSLDIKIEELPNYFDFFLPLAGSEVYSSSNDNEADRNASYKMASLYDLLIDENPHTYNSKDRVHHLNIFLSRLLFCFFAEDTEIFAEESVFTNTLAQHTSKDGADTHLFLNELFKRLNTKDGSKYPAYLAKFPYVNGGLFKDTIDAPLFTSKARKTLIDLGELEWKNINPDIFGSMIQAVVIPEYRSDLGMHYTSVPNILKLIKPLFLDELYEEFEKTNTVKQLRLLMQRMSKIKFFDPACGSGNFLIITYKEIRLLEIRILQKIIDLSPNPTLEFTQIQLSQFYGIELDDFAHEMAILSLWLAEHQMNSVFDEQLAGFGQSKPILPLKEAGQIKQGNATRLNWKEVCPIEPNDEVYIIGNPPYLGAREQNEEQKNDIKLVYSKYSGSSKVDYIFPWFLKASEYIQGNIQAKFSFVSTNSICQGEQVALLWPHILHKKLEIGFAYNSFKWNNNAKGNAGVTVVIIGIRNRSSKPKRLFQEKFIKEVKNISPYLIEGSDNYITKRTRTLSSFPRMEYGNMAIDGGNLLLSREEKKELIAQCKEAEKIIKRVMGAQEFLNGKERYCLWIPDDELQFALSIPVISQRIVSTKEFRLSSSDKGTHKIAKRPHQFREMKESESAIIVPTVTSERRDYLPIDFLSIDKNVIAPNQVIYDADPIVFAIISSKMHIIWVRAVGGKMKTDYRYSSTLCYNTFPFPNISLKQKENLNLYVFAILDERAKHPSKTLAQLYNPETMPKGLKEAHHELDEAIEKCYRLQPFKNDTERLEYLFKEYEKMINKETLFAKPKKTRKK
ncbi:N-6 DNA methylase [Labilibaculum sp. K2S]|uniref:DNA methyltransferase n=1 Tax=Labilibaculum sp. K2S TaxID=3056386 RepID=UPI0025A40FA0|nr:DNA methyltransferase [Labilibaculum sp. K2S]MDM8160588.1 N-6 DNA methylase [Labilibaculum sp. K2S]